MKKIALSPWLGFASSACIVMRALSLSFWGGCWPVGEVPRRSAGGLRCSGRLVDRRRRLSPGCHDVPRAGLEAGQRQRTAQQSRQAAVASGRSAGGLGSSRLAAGLIGCPVWREQWTEWGRISRLDPSQLRGAASAEPEARPDGGCSRRAVSPWRSLLCALRSRRRLDAGRASAEAGRPGEKVSLHERRCIDRLGSIIIDKSIKKD